MWLIDFWTTHVIPPLPTTVTESLLPPSMNENNGRQFVTSHSNIGNPHHVGLSDNITLPDGGLTTNFHLDIGHQVASHPSNVSEREPLYHVEIAEQLKSDPITNSPPEPHHGTGIPTPQIPAEFGQSAGQRAMRAMRVIQASHASHASHGSEPCEPSENLSTRTMKPYRFQNAQSVSNTFLNPFSWLRGMPLLKNFKKRQLRF